MAGKYCQNCKYKYEAKSIYDFFVKTGREPPLRFWKSQEFGHLCWLCTNENISDKVHTNGNMMNCKTCADVNYYGDCSYYKEDNCVDIIPSTTTITPAKTTYTKDEAGTLTVTVTPAVITPAVTETVTSQVPRVDENNDPVLDDENNQIIDTVTTTNTITPAVTNDQTITYKYQWYKNDRKLFKEKSASLTLDTSEVSVNEYYCSVLQSITDNGDGGLKSYTTYTNKVTITVEEAEADDNTDDSDNATNNSGDDTANAGD